MLRSSIRSADEKFDIKNANEILDNPNHHKMMRKELCMNIFPFGLDGADPIMAVKLVRTIEYPSVQHIGSTLGPHVFSTQNHPVQHQNPSVPHQKPLSFTSPLSSTQGCMELGGFRCGTEGFFVSN